MKQRTEILHVGAEVRISEVGHYNVWYPHRSDSIFLEEEVEVQEYSLLKHHRSETWKPMLFPEEIARKYGSPINVLWVRK